MRGRVPAPSAGRLCRARQVPGARPAHDGWAQMPLKPSNRRAHCHCTGAGGDDRPRFRPADPVRVGAPATSPSCLPGSIHRSTPEYRREPCESAAHRRFHHSLDAVLARRRPRRRPHRARRGGKRVPRPLLELVHPTVHTARPRGQQYVRLAPYRRLRIKHDLPRVRKCTPRRRRRLKPGPTRARCARAARRR